MQAILRSPWQASHGEVKFSMVSGNNFLHPLVIRQQRPAAPRPQAPYCISVTALASKSVSCGVTGSGVRGPAFGGNSPDTETAWPSGAMA